MIPATPCVFTPETKNWILVRAILFLGMAGAEPYRQRVLDPKVKEVRGDVRHDVVLRLGRTLQLSIA